MRGDATALRRWQVSYEGVTAAFPMRLRLPGSPLDGCGTNGARFEPYNAYVGMPYDGYDVSDGDDQVGAAVDACAGQPDTPPGS